MYAVLMLVNFTQAKESRMKCKNHFTISTGAGENCKTSSDGGSHGRAMITWQWRARNSKCLEFNHHDRFGAQRQLLPWKITAQNSCAHHHHHHQIITIIMLTVHLGPWSRIADGHALHQVVGGRLHVDRLTVTTKRVLALYSGCGHGGG